MSTRKRSGRNTRAVCSMIDARSARVCSTWKSRFRLVYSPFRRLMIPGTRTKSTRERKLKRPTMGEPLRMRTFSFLWWATSECAIVRHRLRCPSPNESWL